jgi:hypothetical protein
MAKRRGEFEANFASGLDLSELTTQESVTTKSFELITDRTQKTSSSHSANLLLIKQAELTIKRQNEQEDMKIQNLIENRAVQLNQVVSNANIPVLQLPPPMHDTQQPLLKSTNVRINSGNSCNSMIHTVLVGMHEETNRKGCDSMPRKMLMKRNLSHNNKSSKKMIAKKTMKRKY